MLKVIYLFQEFLVIQIVQRSKKKKINLRDLFKTLFGAKAQSLPPLRVSARLPLE
jgi:hypothetical protein